MAGTAPSLPPTAVVIDLNDPQEAYLETYQPDRVVEWLRGSGGTLGERAMKCAAANLIEASLRNG